jgi:hypothetical protein
MKHKKQITDAVRAANQANSKLSSGPKTERGKSNSSKNSLRHGLLTRNLKLETHAQRKELRRLKRRRRKDLRPEGLIQDFLVEEITTLLWKLGIVEPLLVHELLRRQELSENALGCSFLGNDLELPTDNYKLPVDRGWDCERLVVRAVSVQDHRSSQALSSPAINPQNQFIPGAKNLHDSGSQNNANLLIEAVVGNALNNLTRYQAKIKRDLYIAIDRLERRKRKERKKKDDCSLP